MAWVDWGTPDIKCSEYTNPIARWMGNCPDVQISPVYVTPAAPRSVAELTSGLWTPAEAMRLTLEKYTAEKQRVRDLNLAGNWQMPSGGNDPAAPKKELDASDWILIGGGILAGLVVVKAVLK